MTSQASVEQIAHRPLHPAMTDFTWGEQLMELVAIDLEGSGAQDRDNEAILEIALVPIINWQPDMASAYCTLVNPQRPIRRRPWISPGLTNAALRTAPLLPQVEPELARRINGKILVGHNVGVDWRLLHRRCPDIKPTGLIDTLRLARTLNLGVKNGLTAIIRHFDLTGDVTKLATASQPHRALWDSVAVALLLPVLARTAAPADETISAFLATVSAPASATAIPGQQDGLFD
jgi:DNA polymerase III subunit epsilon